MPTFHPPNIKCITDIDTAKVTYRDSTSTVQGVVGPNQSGWEGRDSTYRVHCLSFAVWCEIPDSVVRQSLTILRPVEGHTDGYFKDFPESSLQTFEVVLSDCGFRAVLTRELEPTDAPESLIAAAEQLKQPVVVATNLFGDLTLNRKYNWFEGKADWNGVQIDVTLDADSDELDPAILENAQQLWENQSDWQKRIDECLVRNLLELKNDGWLQDDETEYTAREFLAAITLQTINLSEDESFEFWYDDGGLFGHHAIDVYGTISEGPEHADIAG